MYVVLIMHIYKFQLDLYYYESIDVSLITSIQGFTFYS